VAVPIALRPVVDDDLPALFDQQRDPVANHQAAFTAEDPDDRVAFTAHWARIRNDESVVIRAIVADGRLAGSVLRYEDEGRPEVSYWIDRELWGRGIATAALTAFLDEVSDRPIFARIAHDNAGSLRVLQKCGFAVVGEDRGYATARAEEISEYVLRLDGSASGQT